MTASMRPDLPMGMPAARKLSGDELGLVLLTLLADADGYGTELGDRIEYLSGGFYRPSPGSLYPVLTALGRDGYVAQQREGRRKYYRLTDRGRDYRREHAGTAERVVARLERAGRKYRALRQAMADIADSDEEGASLAQDLLEARMELKSILHRSLDRPPAVQRRIVALLDETAERLNAILDEAPKG